MAFHKNKGSVIVYAYGARPPTVNLELVEDQMHKAHRYKNKLIEIEHQRRAAYHDACAWHPPVCQSLVQERDLKNQLQEVRQQIKKHKEDTGASDAPSDLRRVAGEIKKNLKKASKLVRSTEAQAKDVPHIAEALRLSSEEASESQRRLRAECGLYWGTYLIVERSIARTGPPPRFQRWDGSGTIAVQIQHGMTSDQLAECSDSRLRIPAPLSYGRPRSKNRTTVSMRVGSDGRDPIFAEIPIAMYRPLPDDGSIKWALLHRKRVADRTIWELHVSVEMPEKRSAPVVLKKPRRIDGRVLALDVGWRTKSNGALRVAVGVNRDGVMTEIEIPPWLISSFRHVDGLRSVRDKMFDEIRGGIVSWKKDAVIPDWLAEDTSHVHQWKSPRRLAILRASWKPKRFDGDQDMFAAIEAWYHRDRHLYQWECHRRRRNLNTRKELYRLWAKHVSDNYDALILENLDLRKLARDDPEEGAVAGGQRQIAAVSELRQCLVNACVRDGITVYKVPAKYTTARCSYCGHLCSDIGATLVYTCPACSEQWDQDTNAARNLVAYASAGVVPFSVEALAQSIPAGIKRIWEREIGRGRRGRGLDKRRSQDAWEMIEKRGESDNAGRNPCSSG